MKPPFILAIVCTAVLGISTAGFAADPPAKSSDAKGETKAAIAPAEIKGEVLKVDGDSFLVNDERTKKEVKFTIEKDVKATLERPLKQGDRIEAYLTPEGFAKKVRLEGAKEQDGQSPMNQTGKGLGQSPGGFSRELPSSEGSGRQDQGGVKSPEGSNPTLSPGGKGSASGG
jgi:hypothetical protein